MLAIGLNRSRFPKIDGALISSSRRMAECDAQRLGQLLPRAANENAPAPGSTEPKEASDVDARVGAALTSALAANIDAHIGAEEGPAGAAHSAAKAGAMSTPTS
jgi:hypothetical protein